MAPVQIEGVDERDSAWEEHHPRFRVYLHSGGETSAGGATATYDITGADVLQVIDWAQRQTRGSMTYAVALVCDDAAREQSQPGDGRGLVWLVGMDGNDVARDRSEAETQYRMLSRRQQPVGIPASDQMPGDQATRVSTW